MTTSSLVSGSGESWPDRKSTRLNSSHLVISYAVFCLKKKMKAFTSLIRSQRFFSHAVAQRRYMSLDLFCHAMARSVYHARLLILPSHSDSGQYTTIRD